MSSEQQQASSSSNGRRRGGLDLVEQAERLSSPSSSSQTATAPKDARLGSVKTVDDLEPRLPCVDLAQAAPGRHVAVLAVSFIGGVLPKSSSL